MELPHETGYTRITKNRGERQPTEDRVEITGFYKEVIEQLNKNQVEFLLVGGLAVGFYGYARFTGDMDLWLNPSKDNLHKLGKALINLKYSTDVVNEILFSRPVDHPTPIRIFSEDEQLKVDLMTSIFYEPLTFQACQSRAINQDLGGILLPVIGINDLIEIKSNVKRSDDNLKDLVDAQELRKILTRSKSIDVVKRSSLWNKLFKKS